MDEQEEFGSLVSLALMIPSNGGHIQTADFDSEPEFRLVFLAVAMVMCGIGMFLFGYTMAIGAPAELCAFLQGVMMFGVLIGIFSTLSYALDAFRSQSNEMFVMNMLFKVRGQKVALSCKMLYGLSWLTCGNTSSELHVLRFV